MLPVPYLECGPSSLKRSAATSRTEHMPMIWCFDVLTASFFFLAFLKMSSKVKLCPTSFSRLPHLVLHLNLRLKQNVLPPRGYFTCAQIEAVAHTSRDITEAQSWHASETHSLTAHHFCPTWAPPGTTSLIFPFFSRGRVPPMPPSLQPGNGKTLGIACTPMGMGQNLF